MELLKQLYKVHSPSGKEGAMRNFIIAWAKKHGLRPETDKVGNLYITKGTAKNYPCVVAHMDEVHATRPNKFKVVLYKGNYLLGGDAETLRPCGIGADDKNGIWCALKCLEKFDVAKAAFFVKEEVGCVGSKNADMTFFTDCRFVLQADRKGSSDFINIAGGTTLCDSNFIEKMGLKKHGYKVTTGMMTDVMTLKENGLAVACANVSCGYYNPHTADEYTSFVELENCLAFIEDAFTNIVEVCPHKHVHSYDVNYKSSGMGSKYPFVDWMKGDDEDEHVINKYGSTYMNGGYGKY